MTKVLIIVDMQKDFMPQSLLRKKPGGPDYYRDGALAVEGGRKIVPNIVKEAYSGYDLIVATRDFHPGNHISFQELGGEWPMHCVAGTEGAQLLPEIDMIADVIVSKGTNPKVDSYSGFDKKFDSTLENICRSATAPFMEGELVICGVATDYCVQATALDAKRLGFKTTVLLDCIAGVDEETTGDALIHLQDNGIELRTRG